MSAIVVEKPYPSSSRFKVPRSPSPRPLTSSGRSLNSQQQVKKQTMSGKTESMCSRLLHRIAPSFPFHGRISAELPYFTWSRKYATKFKPPVRLERLLLLNYVTQCVEHLRVVLQKRIRFRSECTRPDHSSAAVNSG